MRERLDPLIAERAPWLARDSFAADLARPLLDRLLSYPQTLALAETLRPLDRDDVLATVSALVARDVEVAGLENLPRNGPAIVVANHPTGIADGIVLHHVLAPLRPDLYIYTNRDVLRVLPQLADLVAPVEWRPEKRSHAKARETMEFTLRAIEDGRLGVIFPSGRLAKRHGLRLVERPWMATAATLARKHSLPVIPLHISARNSVLFYLFDLIHPTLRDITLFHEVLNKGRQPFRVTLGKPIEGERLPPRSDEAIAMLRAATLALGGRHAPAVSLVQATRRPAWLKGARIKGGALSG
jgi:putative hemolysin